MNFTTIVVRKCGKLRLHNRVSDQTLCSLFKSLSSHKALWKLTIPVSQLLTWLFPRVITSVQVVFWLCLNCHNIMNVTQFVCLWCNRRKMCLKYRVHSNNLLYELSPLWGKPKVKLDPWSSSNWQHQSCLALNTGVFIKPSSHCILHN